MTHSPKLKINRLIFHEYLPAGDPEATPLHDSDIDDLDCGLGV